MRFNSNLAHKYRKNGHIVIAHDPKTGYYDIFISKGGKQQWTDVVTNKAVAEKIAKRMAMEEKLGFNKETDLIY